MAKVNPVKFLKEVKQELSKVVWPTKKETIRLTLAVILVSILIGVFIDMIDYVLTRIMVIIIR